MNARPTLRKSHPVFYRDNKMQIARDMHFRRNVWERCHIMNSGVLLLQANNSLVRMDETPYEAESLLQCLLENHPDLLACDQIDVAAPRHWLLVGREAGVPESEGSSDRWALDHLFLDQDAVPTFVEVKRASDTRSRREVVAQMLDYAANGTEYWPVDRMRELFAGRCAARGLNSSEEVANFIGNEGDEEEFWTRAGSNLREGRIRLLFVADQIPPALQRIVEFLNKQMSPAEVLAVEIRQFAPVSDRTLRTLVPRVIGQTEQIRAAKSFAQSRATAAPIDRDTFLQDAPPALSPTMQEVLNAAESSGLSMLKYARAGDSRWVIISTPATSGSPCSLTYEHLWVSLGRHHPSLRDPQINADLRDAILNVSPSARSAADQRKTEVGIRLDSIAPERSPALRNLFDVLVRGLTS